MLPINAIVVPFSFFTHKYAIQDMLLTFLHTHGTDIAISKYVTDFLWVSVQLLR